MLTRRSFSRLLALSPLAGAGTLPTRRLGRIPFEASMLGLGAQRIGEARSDQATVDRIVAEALDHGLNYIDTAQNYGASEERLGRALKGRRGKVFLVSKIETRTRADALHQVHESLRRLQTDWLDGVLVHNIAREDRYPDIDAALCESGSFGGLIEARKQGLVRHLGCSTHTAPGRVLKAFATGEVELLMCPINFVENHIYHHEENLLPEARRRNIAIIAMKVLGGPRNGPGALLETPEDYRATLRYAWGVPGVAVAIIGLRTPEELRAALATARSYQPLSDTEMAALTRRGQALAAKWGAIRGPVT